MHSWGSSYDPWAMDITGSWQSRELWPKAPPDSVFLLEATNVVGRAMWGHDWSLPPFDDLPDEIGGPSPSASRFDITITRIGAACEKGEIAVMFKIDDADLDAPAPSRGEIPTDTWRWFNKVIWRRRFINGRDEAFVIDGRDEIFCGWLFVRQTDLAQFIESIQPLKDSAASATAFNKQETPRPLPPVITKMLQPPSELVQKRRRGRNPKHDWEEAGLFFEQEWDKRGDPADEQNKERGWESDSDVARLIQKHLKRLASAEPDLSTVRKWLRPVLALKRGLGRN
jgi:hypothetical protein